MIRLNQHVSAKVARSLPHAPDSHARTLRLNFRKLFRRNSFPFILHHEDDAVTVARHSNRGTLASAVAVNVGQTLLHEPEHYQFHFAGKTLEVRRNIECDFKAAAFGETLNIPT